jgi:hypothetical protein
VYRLLVGKPEGQTPLGIPSHMWVEHVKMDLVERAWGGVDWISLAQDRDKWRAVLNAVINLRVPEIAVKLSSDYITCGLCSRAELHRVSWFLS